MRQENQVHAVVVTYQPEISILGDLLRALQSQTHSVIVVDNTPAHDSRVEGLLADACFEGIRLFRFGTNHGIASAINVGIKMAVEGGASHVLLSDQDSLPSSDMVAVLCNVLECLEASGIKVGCVNPEYFDRTTNQSFPFQAILPDKFFYTSKGGANACPWVEIATGITSGALIPCAALEEVGGMREDFFIDYVDTEWCHRARYKGYSLFGTACTRLNHRLGEESFRVWLFGWRPYVAYSPLRLYYRFRNFILLLRFRHVDMRWKLRAGWYWLGNAYAYIIFSPRRIQNLRMIAKGIKDGVLNHAGEIRHPE